MALFTKQNKALINMDADNADPNERYKMHRVRVQSEGKRSGKVTVLTNILLIVKDILGTKMGSDGDDDSRCASSRYSDAVINNTAVHVSKFLSKSLGATAKYRRERLATLINGQFTEQQLQRVMHEYVIRFAQCPQCRLPELTPAVLKHVCCKSCGHAPGKRAQRNQKSKKRTKGKAQRADAAAAESESKEPEPARESAESVLRRYVANNADASSDVVLEKLKILSIAHRLDRRAQMELALRGLLCVEESDCAAVIAAIGKHRVVLAHFTQKSRDAAMFMSAFEGLVVSNNGRDLQAHWYRVLQALYDCDVVCEDGLMAWYQRQAPQKRRRRDEWQVLRENAEPFIQWLQQAEEEDDDEDDDGGQED